MAAWRNLAVVPVLLAIIQPAWGQTYALSENSRAGDCFRVHLDLVLSGEIKISKDGKQIVLKQEGAAAHEFPERVLSVGAAALPSKVARVYEKASSTISVNGEFTHRQLRAERRLVVAQRQKEQALVYSPAGALTREELELTDHFDTLDARLLSGKPGS